MATSKREQILASALTLFVEKGISDTSTASIAKGAGVATGTLFHHFANKQAIVDGLYRHLKEQIASQMTSAESELEMLAKAKSYWLTCLNCFINNTEALKFFQLYYATPSVAKDNKFAVIKDTFGFFLDFIDRAKQAGLFIDLPQEYIMSHCQQGLFNTAQFLIDYPEHFDEIKRKSFELHFGALLTAQGHAQLAKSVNEINSK